MWAELNTCSLIPFKFFDFMNLSVQKTKTTATKEVTFLLDNSDSFFGALECKGCNFIVL